MTTPATLGLPKARPPKVRLPAWVASLDALRKARARFLARSLETSSGLVAEANVHARRGASDRWLEAVREFASHINALGLLELEGSMRFEKRMGEVPIERLHDVMTEALKASKKKRKRDKAKKAAAQKTKARRPRKGKRA